MSSPSRKFILLSDLDDTIKISHSMDSVRTVLRGLFSHDTYTGMAELYTELLAGGHSSLVVLSSSPKWIKKRIQEFLRRNGFPSARILLRDWLKQPDIRHYKLEALRSLAKETQLPFMLIGDDTEFDPEVFNTFAEDYGERILKIYIHRMRGRPLPESVEPFHTAYEIALSEMLAGRLTKEQVLSIGTAIIRSSEHENLIPYFAICPEQIHIKPESPELFEIHQSIVERLSEIARIRKLTAKPA